MKVLSFGSLNIDYTYKVEHFVQKGETLSSESLQVFSGGKGLNQSIALAKAGANVYHAGAIGEDGKFLLEIMEEAGVNTSCVFVLKDVRTGNAIIQNDKDGDNCILLYGGANQSITKSQIDQVLSGFEKNDFLVLQNEINEVKYIMETAYRKGMKIVLNPSPMNNKIFELPLEYVDYFLLNEVEAQQILNIQLQNDYDINALIEAFKERFPNANIVLTLGSAGSVFINDKKKFRQGIFKVKAIDTTAAGDTFTGFFLAGILSGLSEEESMERAAKASAIAVTRRGAAPSIPTMNEVDNF